MLTTFDRIDGRFRSGVHDLEIERLNGTDLSPVQPRFGGVGGNGTGAAGRRGAGGAERGKVLLDLSADLLRGKIAHHREDCVFGTIPAVIK